MMHDMVGDIGIKVGGERAPRGLAFGQDPPGTGLGRRDPGILAIAGEERQADRHAGRDKVAETGVAALIGQVDTEVRAPTGVGHTHISIRLVGLGIDHLDRSEEHTSELQSLMRISYAVFCLKKKTKQTKDKRTKN